MKILILQFSGTGNTYYVSQSLKNALEILNHEVIVYPIEKVDNINEIINEFEIIGFGYPIYGSDLPKLVKTMIDKIDIVFNKRAFVFCTQMMYSGDGAAYLAKTLVKKGFIVRQCEHFNMPNNLRDYAKFLPTRVKYKRLEIKTVRKTNRFARLIDKNFKRQKGLNIFSNILGLLQRVPYQKLTEGKNITIYIDDNCILCKKCLKLCPVNNLRYENNQIVDNKQCILCYRCINNCPSNSLNINPKKTVDKPYHGPTKNFNIYDVMKID